MNGVSGGYTRTTYSYNPELDEALKRLQAIAAQYKLGGNIYKTQTAALESGLQQGKRKSMSNIAQQLVSAGLAGTTALPSAELGYEAEVMAPARTQLEAGLAQQQLTAELAIAQHMAQQQQAVQQMQYGATMQAAQLAARRAPAQSTGFMQSAAGGGGGGGGGTTLGSSLGSTYGLQTPYSGGGTTGGGGGTVMPTLSSVGYGPEGPGTYWGAQATGGMSNEERAAAERLVTQGYATPLQRVLSQPGYTASLVGYGPEGPGTYQGQGAAKLMYPEQWW